VVPADGLRPSARFVWATGAVVVVAFAVRLGFGLLVAADLPPASDSAFYRDVAARLADGDGFVTQGRFLAFVPADEVVPTAKHPPVFPVVLAAGNLVGIDSWGAQRAFLAGVAALGVGLVAVAGRLLVSGRVGVVAAALAAIHPLWWQHQGMVVSEAVYLPVVAAVLAAAGLALRRPGTRAFVGLGLVVGVAVLTRVEALLLLPFVVGPLVWALPARRRQALWMVPLVSLLVVAPWVVRNQVVMGTATVSLNGGTTLVGANCDEAYRGPSRGAFVLQCAFGGVAAAGASVDRSDRSAVDLAARDLALEYMRDHADELPVVMVSRVGRTLGVVGGDGFAFDVAEGRDEASQRIGSQVHLLALPSVVLGAALLVRRRGAGPAAILIGSIVAALVTGAAVYGSTRMRATAEPAFVILTATAAVAVAESVFGTRRPAAAPARAQERGSA
jgi:hypothetical protein